MQDSIRIEEKAAEWLARQDCQNWSDADQLVFVDWLEASTANRIAYLRLAVAWQRAHQLKALAGGTPRGELPPVGKWLYPSSVDRCHLMAVPEIPVLEPRATDPSEQ
jgi:ferric-dicitrate binding protein FerR (iron transport regulator)